MQIAIRNISHEEKTSKNGKQYSSCKITVWNTKENKESILSGFTDGVNKTWNAGDTVDVDLSQNEKGYWNFAMNKDSKPSESPILKVLKEISSKLDVLCADKLINTPTKPQATVETATNFEPKPSDVKVEDIPF